MWIAYGIAWLATGIATSVGIYITKDANCLWAMLIPGMISLSSKGDKTNKEEIEE